MRLRLVLLLFLHLPLAIPFVLQWKSKTLRCTGGNELLRLKLSPKPETQFCWDDMIVKLQVFYEAHGTSDVKAHEDEELFEWCKRLRNRYTGKRISRLPESRRQQLEQVRFAWNLKDLQWKQRFDELAAFVGQHGHSRVSRSHSTLGMWVASQRRLKREHRLKPERNEALSSIGFWESRKRLASKKKKKTRRKRRKWGDMIVRLEEYYQQQGHVIVRKEEDADLFEWCRSIRTNHGYSDPAGSSLSLERQQQLKKVNFCWNVREGVWQQRFAELCEFQAAHGHCYVPNNHPTLGNWVSNQRQNYRFLLRGQNSTITPARLQALESIGFLDTCQSQEDLWNQRCKELQEFYQTYNHSNVPAYYAANYQLGQWVSNQRLFHKRYMAGESSPLTLERIQVLDKLDFSWNLHERKWSSMLDRLQRYQEDHGHLKIDKENFDLRVWLAVQRHAYSRMTQNRTSSMTESRQSALEAIPGFEWHAFPRRSDTGPSDDDWNELFDQLREKDLTVSTWLDIQYRQSDDKEVYTEEDLLDLWNSEED